MLNRDVIEILLLTAEDELRAQFMKLIGSHNPVQIATNPAEAKRIVARRPIGVLIADTATLSTDLHSFLEDLAHYVPGLAAVAIGDRDQGEELMGLASEGSLYRFLFKPLSLGQARRALDAAVSHYAETGGVDLVPADAAEPAASTVPSATARPFRLYAGAAVAALVLGAALVWTMTGDEDPATRDAPDLALADTAQGLEPEAAIPAESPDLAPTLATEPAEPGPAFSAASPDPARPDPGASADPVTASAGRYVKPAPVPVRGKTQTPPAQTAPVPVAQPDLTVRRKVVAAAPAVTPPAAATPTAAATPQATATPAVRTTTQAVEQKPEPPAETSAEPAPPADDSYGMELIDLARASLDDGRLLAPAESNALAYLSAAIDAGAAAAHSEALSTQLRSALLEGVHARIADGAPDEAEEWLAAAATLAGDPQSIAAASESIVWARQALERAALERSRLAGLFTARLSGGQLTAPAEDNAFFYLAALAQISPEDDPGLSRARTQAAAARDEVVHGLLLEQGPEAARAAFTEFETLASVGGATPLLAEIRRVEAIEAAQLVRRRYVPPDYPRRARVRGQEGFVQLEFTVAPDGDTRDIRIMEAKPHKIFDRAAIDALEQWEYEPVMIDGEAVERRAQVQILFALDAPE